MPEGRGNYNRPERYRRPVNYRTKDAPSISPVRKECMANHEALDKASYEPIPWQEDFVTDFDSVNRIMSSLAGRVVSLAAGAVRTNPLTEDILRTAFPQASDKNLYTALDRMRRLSDRRVHLGMSRYMGRYMKLPGRKSRICGMAFGEGEDMKLEASERLLRNMGRTLKPGRIILSPAVIYRYPFIVNGGLGIGKLEGVMHEAAVATAGWVEQFGNRSGYLAFGVCSYAGRIWSPEAQEILDDYQTKLELSPIIAWAVEAWNLAHPLEGGAWGLGKKS